MSSTVSYKGSTLCTVNNNTKTLLTEGKYLEDNITIVDVTQGGSATLIEKSVTANGVYTASSDSADGYSKVTVAVPASAVDTGTKNISSNGTHDVIGYASASVSVPNSYSAGDEGKVVSNGALVAQTSDSVTQNGTVDTTLINSLTVNVSGGGITVASGTTVGSNNTGDAGRHQFSIGTKMANKDFVFQLYAENGAEFAYGTSRQFVTLNYAFFHEYGSFDISTTGNKTFTASSYYVNSNNSGTITQKNAGFMVAIGKQIYNGSLADITPNQFQIRRMADHFEIYMGMSNNLYVFPAITYNWKVVYFGTNPSTDIVEIS